MQGSEGKDPHVGSSAETSDQIQTGSQSHADNDAHIETLEKIRKGITEALEQVDAIPKFSVGDESDLTLKAKLRPILKGIEQRVDDVGILYEKLEVVRREIVGPVNRSIHQSSRLNLWLGSLGLCFGVVGLWAPLSAITGYLSKDGQSITRMVGFTIRSLDDIDPENTSGVLWRDRTGMTGESQVAHNAAIAAVLDLETALSSTGAPPTADQLEKFKKTLEEALYQMSLTSGRNQTANALVAYGLLALDAYQGKWADVQKLAESAVAQNLQVTDHGLAIHAYRAEALLLFQSPEAAISVYEQAAQLQGAMLVKRFLSPTTRQMVDGQSYLVMRLAELRSQKELGNAVVRVYFPSNDQLGGQLVQTLVSKRRLAKTRADGAWGGGWTYRQPFIYYRESASRQALVEALSAELTTLLKISKVDSLNFANAKDKWAQDRFDKIRDLSAVVILPSRSK